MTRPTESLSDEEVWERINTVPHWYHQIPIRHGIVTPGINDSPAVLRHLELPDDCSGTQALDIGVRDGYFAFELERRGADVTAIDYIDPSETGFPIARDLLGSRVEYRVDNVYRLDPELHGEFDLVLFLGVLYHLRDPLLALDRIWDVCREGARVIVESQLLDEALLLADGTFAPLALELRETPLMQFYPGATLRGDPSNYWAPNLVCMRGLLEAAGFDVERAEVLGARGVFHARKVIDAERQYHRRLEKGTFAQVVPPAASPGPASIEARTSDEIKRLEHDLAIVRNEKAALETQLARTRVELAAVRRAAGDDDEAARGSVAQDLRRRVQSGLRRAEQVARRRLRR